MKTLPLLTLMDGYVRRSRGRVRSINQLAALIGRDRSYVHRILHGERRPPLMDWPKWCVVLKDPLRVTSDELRKFQRIYEEAARLFPRTRRRSSAVQLVDALYRVDLLEEELVFHTTETGQADDSIALEHRPVAVAMVAAALKAGMILKACARNGRVGLAALEDRTNTFVFTVYDHDPGTDLMRSRSAMPVASAYVALVGGWAAINSVRRHLVPYAVSRGRSSATSGSSSPGDNEEAW